MSKSGHCWASQQWHLREQRSESKKVVRYAAVFSEYSKHSHLTRGHAVLMVELAPLREVVGGLYTRVLAELADSGQIYRLALTQGFAAVGVVIISAKMDLFGALCRGRVAD